ncbi:MAG: flagellar brake protein [Methylococcaceae bacterium]
MLETIKKLFTKKENPADMAVESYDPKSSSNPNFLIDPKKIIKLLKDIEDTSPLCTINIEGISEEFSSSILDIQIDKKQIIIDELIPKHGNELLVNSINLKLSTIYNGIRLAFQLNNIKTDSSRGIAYYKAAIPQRIYYPQRRSCPRIQLTSVKTPFSGVSERTNSTVGGNIFDLSRGGLGVTIPNNIARFQRGDTIKNSRITLDDSTINFNLTVRFVKTTNKGRGDIQIGGYFENINSKDQNKLEHFVASLEREEIRKRKR